MVTHLADRFTAVSVLTGLWAALLWWRSGRVEVDETGLPPTDTIENILDRGRWAAFNRAIDRTGLLNGHAAI